MALGQYSTIASSSVFALSIQEIRQSRVIPSCFLLGMSVCTAKHWFEPFNDKGEPHRANPPFTDQASAILR
jgi:hypothetical protein